MNKVMVPLALAGLLLAACALPSTATPVAPTVTPAPMRPSDTPQPSPTAAPILEPTLTPETRPASFADFAALSGNLATGEPAPDLTARVLGVGAFTLSKQRGSFILLIPTVVGCGDCILTLQEIAKVYPDYRGQGLKVIMLNLYPDDVPESWQEYMGLVNEPEFLWGVVDSIDFVIQYNITTPGTLLLVDRDGNLVFRSNTPIRADDFRRLFDLTTQ